MQPILFRLPLVNLPIYAYGMMMMLGFIASLSVLVLITRRYRVDPNQLVDLAIVSLIAGIVGARIFYYVQFYEEQFSQRSFLAIFAIWQGGLVYHGGLLLGVPAGIIFLRRKKLPLLPLADAVAVVLPLGLAFGRIGCFLNGCCWGERWPVDSPLALTFPVGSPPFEAHFRQHLVGEESLHSLPVFPTQLASCVIALLIFALLLHAFLRARLPQGCLILALGLLYGSARFNIEFLRINEAALGNLSLYQLVSLGLVGLCLPLYLRQRWRGPPPWRPDPALTGPASAG